MVNLYTYRLTVDMGDSPNPYNNICSLAICKPVIRKCAKVGDWVAGFVSKRLDKKDHGKLLYAMEITQKLTFEEYNTLCKIKYKDKLPENKNTGDCIYYMKNNKIKQRANYAHNKENMLTDLSGKYVLLSNNFYYFGKNSINIPEKLHPIIIKSQGHQKGKNKDYVNNFIKFINTQKKGIQGEPYMKMPNIIVKNYCKSKCNNKTIVNKC